MYLLPEANKDKPGLVFTIKNCSLAFAPDPIIIVELRSSVAPLCLWAMRYYLLSTKVDVKHIFLFVYKHSDWD